MQVILVIVGIAVYLAAVGLALVFVTTPGTLILVPLGALAGVGLTVYAFTEVLLGATTTRVCGPAEAERHEIGERPAPVPGPGDRAWPNYFVRQVRHDVDRVGTLTARRIKHLWRFTHGWWDDEDVIILVVATFPVWLPVEAGLAAVTAAAAVTFLAGVVIIGLVTLLAWAAGVLCGTALRLRERWRQRRFAFDACCVRCHEVTRLPAFKCPGPHGDGRADGLHRDVRPGRRGVLWRRCGCGHRIPTTVRRASRSLRPLCPMCLTPLPAGSGAVTDVRVAFFGASGAGQTSLVLSSLAAIADRGERGAVSVAAADDESDRQCRAATGLRAGAWPRPAGDRQQAQITTVRLRSTGDGTLLHLFDTPGKALVDPVLNEQFAFLESARTLVFVINPLQLPPVATLLGRPGRADRARTAAATDPEDAYQASVNRLRLWGVRTSRQRLAVVLTNAGLLEHLREEDRPAGADSAAVRDWLIRTGRLDNVVWAAERDFGRTHFFLHSADGGAAGGQDGSMRLLTWLLRAERSRPDRDLDVVR
jgi:hypothetical protein